VTSGGSGIDGSALGAGGGAETVTLTQAQMARHSHSSTEVSGTTPAGGSCQLNPFTSTADTSTGGAGSGDAHNNMPPAIMLNSIIKT